MGIAIGIDLGTTNSCSAVYLNGQPQVITYRNGAKTIPSVFAIDKSGNRLVGEEAVAQARSEPIGDRASCEASHWSRIRWPSHGKDAASLYL